MTVATIDQQSLVAPKMAYRVDEACYALGIGRTSLYGLVKSGDLKLIKIAGRTLVPRSELERLAGNGPSARQAIQKS